MRQPEPRMAMFAALDPGGIHQADAGLPAWMGSLGAPEISCVIVSVETLSRVDCLVWLRSGVIDAWIGCHPDVPQGASAMSPKDAKESRGFLASLAHPFLTISSGAVRGDQVV